jgi:scyllo-inositol 2-dehydrogenase (NADP+)
MASKSLRAGVIGFGLAGRYFHTPLLLAAGFEIRCVASSRRDEVQTVLPHADVVASAPELIARDDIDLVVIASPNSVHAEQARASLDAGRHVVVDKPLCTSAQQARELARHATQRGRVLAVFQNRRWDSDMLTICKLLADDRLGEINAWHARWDRYRPEVAERWRERDEPGAGMLFDLGSHLIDQVLFLFGRPDWIQADVFAQRAGAIVDDGFELLLGKDSLRITLGVSSLASEGGPRYRIHGAKASFVKSGFDPQEPQLRAGMVPTDPQFGREAREHWGRLTSGASGASEPVPAESGRWVDFYEALRRSLDSGSPPPVSAEEAALTLEVIEAAQRSSAEGRRVFLRHA